MRRWGWRKRAKGTESPLAEVQPAAGWTWGPADVAITAGLLLATVGVCVPVAWNLHGQVQTLDRQREQSATRYRQFQTISEHLESRKSEMARMRREVNRYVADVESRPIVPWTTGISELSRRRPDGVWTVSISGSGSTFRAQVAADRPELLASYAQQLRDSPYVEYVSAPPAPAANPAAAPTRVAAQITGRWMGE